MRFSMTSSAICAPVVRRSVVTKAVVPTAPPINTGTQPVVEVTPIVRAERHKTKVFVRMAVITLMFFSQYSLSKDL